MSSLSQPHACSPRTAGPGARWRSYATKVAVTGVVLVGVAVGCSSQPAVQRGSVDSCYQFGLEAIQRHVTVTAVPAACQGLSQLEVNVAVGRALQAAAAGVRGKSRQRQLIARDSPYLADLIHAVPAPSRAAVAATPSAPPSRAALSLAALAAWLVTVGLGVSMMARWITRTRRHGAQPGHGRRPVLNFTHFGLALTGLLVWISYLATGVTGLAWAACGLLVPVAGLGMTLVFLAPARPGDDPPSFRRPPALVVAAHITAASITILLAVLAAIGSG
jgi:manganese efflux pump family protein